MNEYLTTVVAAEHRRELLDEAASNGLARVARDGRPTVWTQLRSLLGSASGGRRHVGRAHSRTHRFAH